MIDETASPRRIESIERNLRELGPSVAASFASTVADLKAQQDVLAGQQAQLAAALANQVRPASGFDSSDSYALTTSAKELARVNFTVPTGYTRAVVFATGVVGCFNQSSSTADEILGQVDINGHTPAATISWANPATLASSASAYGITLTSLTAGSTFYVRALGWTKFGNTGVTAGASNVTVLAVQVIYLV